MNHKSLAIIVIGLILLVVTYVAFNALYNGIAPTGSELNAIAATGSRQDALKLIERSQQGRLQFAGQFGRVGVLHVLRHAVCSREVTSIAGG